MRLRHRIGLNLAPLVLRLMLGALFLQAGLAKLMRDAEFPPADAAVLVAIGAIPAPAAPAPGAAAPAPPAPGPTEKDLAPPVRARALNAVALTLWHAAHPQDTETSVPLPIWPSRLAEGSRPVYFAWAVAATEAGGGAFILIGLLARFWAVGVAVVMAAAAWLTQIGPALQACDTWLGCLPRRDPLDVSSWQVLWVQVALLMSALALAALGPGRLSVDRLIFGGGGDE
jgi:uncharacterized membrane protein YphA (DoxX/SURF4 family)